MPDAVPLALLGAGVFARSAHHAALTPLIASGAVRIVSVWSRRASSAESLAAQYGASVEAASGDAGLEAVLHDGRVAGVVLAVPIARLAPLALRALAAGKHVLAEKPLAHSGAAGADSLRAWAAMAAPRPVYMVGENFRAEGGLARARGVVEGGGVGEVIGVELAAHMVMPPGSKYAFGWRLGDGAVEHVGGQLLDSGVHHVAGMRIVAGADVERVAAVTAKRTAHLPAVDSAHAVLRFGNGVAGMMVLTFAATAFKWEMCVVGTAGKVELRRATEGGVPGYWFAAWKGGEKGPEEFLPFDGVDNEMKLFVEACRTGTVPKGLGAVDAFNDLATVQAIIDAGETGSFVRVADVPIEARGLE